VAIGNHSDAIYRIGGWIPILIFPFVTAAYRSHLQPWEFMWILAFVIYFGFKWLTWWIARVQIPHKAWRSIAYFACPGMDARAFLDSQLRPQMPEAKSWSSAILKTAAGAISFWVAARLVPPDQALVRGWVGMIGLILLLHFGSLQLIALIWQSLGVVAEPIMRDPLRSTSLAEFWGKRWNLGFRRLAHELAFLPLSRTLGVVAAGFVVFAISGLIHDFVISFPSRGGYGLPTLYFLLQGAGTIVERATFGRSLGLGRDWRGWFFMMFFLLAPLPGLFHPWFVTRVILPFMRAVHAL
jgi:Membrane bound O-acyl transferase family